jgi:hypothetical protein
MIDDALFDDTFLRGSIEIEEDMLFDGSFVSLADDAAIFVEASSESQEEEAWLQEMLFDVDDALFSGNADCSCHAPENVAAPHDDITVVTIASSSNSSHGNSVQGENNSLHTDSAPRQEDSGQTQESSRVSSLQKTRTKLAECMKQSARSRSSLMIGPFLRKTPPGKQEKSVLIRSMVSSPLSLPSLSKKGCQNTASGTARKTSPAKKKRSGGLVKYRIGAHMLAAKTSKKNSMLKMINSVDNIGLDERHFLARCSAKRKTNGMMFRSAGGTSSLALIKKLPALSTPQSTCYQQEEMKTTTISDFLRIRGNASRVQHALI